MMKKIIYIILFAAAAVFTVAFAAFLIIDYTKHYEFGSSPFYVYIFTRGIKFLLPAAVCLIAGIIVKRKK